MRYTLSELLENKKLRVSVAKVADKKELDFEDGNGVFDLDFRGQSLRINHRRTYDTLCVLGGEKLLKKLAKGEGTCLSTNRDDSNQSVCGVRGTENYFLLLNAGASKAFTSILNGIAAWAKMDKSFDAELVSFSDETEVDTEDDAFADCGTLNFDFDEKGWLCQGEEYSGFNLDPVQNGVLAEMDGKPVFVDAETGKRLFIAQLQRQGEMVSCEPLYEDNDENQPLMGYKYRTEAEGKWGFISPRLVRVTPPEYDEIITTNLAWDMENDASMVMAWAAAEDGTIALSFSARATQEETGVEDVWLLSPAFEGMASYYTPTHSASLDTKQMDDGSTVMLYRPDRWLNFGLFKRFRGWHESVVRRVEYKDGFVSEFMRDEKVAAHGLTLEKCLQLGKEEHHVLQLSACVVEPKENGIGSYIIHKDGYWALADVDVSGEPEIRHLSTPLAYTAMELPEDWRKSWLLVERFGKKGIYNWMQEEFVASCEYEEITLDEKLRQYVLVRHGNERRMTERGAWVEEEKPVCPKCKAELVEGALYCHMCGVSLTEPEKQVILKQESKPEPVQEAAKAEEVKPEPVKEAHKPVEPPKPAPKAPEVPKGPAEVPTQQNFREKYEETGSHSQMRRENGKKDKGTLDVCTKWEDTPEADTDPEHFLYANLTIRNKETGKTGGLGGYLWDMKAYALTEDGIVYEKDSSIWFMHVSGEKLLLGKQEKVLSITVDAAGQVVVEYVKRCIRWRHNERRDECGYMYVAWYDVYDVDIGTVTMSLRKPAVAETPAKPVIKVPAKSNFEGHYISMGRKSGVFNGHLRVTTRWNDKDYEDTDPEHFLYGDETIYYYENRSRGSVVGDLSHLAAYALGEKGIFYAKNDEIWYWTEDGTRRKLGQQKKVIRLIDEGSGKLTVEYVERLSGGVANYKDGDYYEEWYDMYDVATGKVTLNY